MGSNTLWANGPVNVFALHLGRLEAATDVVMLLLLTSCLWCVATSHESSGDRRSQVEGTLQRPPAMAAIITNHARSMAHGILRSFPSMRAQGRILLPGTLCSGCDLIVRVLAISLLAWCSVLDVRGVFDLVHVFACESVAWKRRFILEQPHAPRYVFEDACRMGNATAPEARTGGMQPVPPVDLVICGWVCGDSSPMNSARKRRRSEFQAGQGASGSTFEGTLSYIAAHRPRWVILENVPNLAEHDAAMVTRNCDWVVPQYSSTLRTTK